MNYPLITATKCLEKLTEHNILMSKSYFSQLKNSGKIPHEYNPSSKTKIFHYEAVLAALIDTRDPTRDSQREANTLKREHNDLFDNQNLPTHSHADMTDAEKEKYNQDLEEKMAKLESISTDEENASRPKSDGNASEWNTFKIKQQGLNYEIDRKVKERSLMPIIDFKAAAEILLSPLNQGMGNLGFELKSEFPHIGDEVIEWLMERTNQLKVDVQNVSM